MSQDNAKTAINLMRLASEMSMVLSVSTTESVANDYVRLVNELAGVKDKESIAVELLRFNKERQYYPPAELAQMFRAALNKLDG